MLSPLAHSQEQLDGVVGNNSQVVVEDNIHCNSCCCCRVVEKGVDRGWTLAVALVNGCIDFGLLDSRAIERLGYREEVVWVV